MNKLKILDKKIRVIEFEIWMKNNNLLQDLKNLRQAEYPTDMAGNVFVPTTTDDRTEDLKNE